MRKPSDLKPQKKGRENRAKKASNTAKDTKNSPKDRREITVSFSHRVELAVSQTQTLPYIDPKPVGTCCNE
jgi:hypothetical protein